MRIHVLYAHPSPTSFVAALHERVMKALKKGGHEVDDLDLYAERFDPVLSREMLSDYIDVERNTAEVAEYVARLRAADALVLVFPVWFDGLPAILQGYFQRVFLPGVATVIDERGLFHANLKHLKRLAAVAVYGEDERDVAAKGDPPRRFVRDNIGVLIDPHGRFDYLAHYNMNFPDFYARTAFLERVGAGICGVVREGWRVLVCH